MSYKNTVSNMDVWIYSLHKLCDGKKVQQSYYSDLELHISTMTEPPE